MNIQKLKYKFHSGKNSKPWYYIKEYARLYTPACILIEGTEKDAYFWKNE